ncbi:GyrI-like domain-containing protein [Bacillus sonorensis]|uniref:Protein YobU n=2 Tax=Bacillus sonorensis TaxID=119858 RepID=M5P9W2_9BACI|nr:MULTISPECIES: GyrI-like domain-containing protein [Bacillus]TWK82300.1 hypothetical protein CHCC20335_3343 [Bacillus paralicheniformis]ASB88944.1 Putative transcriptional regulator protein YobU [Bacillus sonorensis]EME76249.1 protein YobU [Bacillus sonorensis L12]MCZ0072250.1 GyrI-like domain-containing protein [Bacillus sonorensis]MCZ0090870.1 GyrI-like domain-containing protein [Bacillus sonorensis]
MSFSHVEHLDKKRFSGISTVTSNADEAAGKGRISAMWELFRKQIIKTATSDIIALYSQYETDESGTYTYSIGTFFDACEHGEDVITLPSSLYAVFTSRRGRLEEVVFETWQDIWSWDQKALRTYTGDFEVYGETAANSEDAQVTVYVAVKHENK